MSILKNFQQLLYLYSLVGKCKRKILFTFLKSNFSSSFSSFIKITLNSNNRWANQSEMLPEVSWTLNPVPGLMKIIAWHANEIKISPAVNGAHNISRKVTSSEGFSVSNLVTGLPFLTHTKLCSFNPSSLMTSSTVFSTESSL